MIDADAARKLLAEALQDRVTKEKMEELQRQRELDDFVVSRFGPVMQTVEVGIRKAASQEKRAHTFNYNWQESTEQVDALIGKVKRELEALGYKISTGPGHFLVSF